MLTETLRKDLLNARRWKSRVDCMSSRCKIESYLKICMMGFPRQHELNNYLFKFNSDEELHIAFSHFQSEAECSLTFNVAFRPIIFLHRLHTGERMDSF